MTGFVGIGAALRDRLKSHERITELGLAEKIFPERLPQNPTLPAVTYEIASDIPFDTIDGRASLYRAIVFYKPYAKTKVEADKIEDALRVALRGYQGTNLGVNIRGIHHLHSMSDFEGEVSDYKEYVRFSIFYRRDDPDEDDS